MTTKQDTRRSQIAAITQQVDELESQIKTLNDQRDVLTMQYYKEEYSLEHQQEIIVNDEIHNLYYANNSEHDFGRFDTRPFMVGDVVLIDDFDIEYNAAHLCTANCANSMSVAVDIVLRAIAESDTP